MPSLPSTSRPAPTLPTTSSVAVAMRNVPTRDGAFEARQQTEVPHIHCSSNAALKPTRRGLTLMFFRAPISPIFGGGPPF